MKKSKKLVQLVLLLELLFSISNAYSQAPNWSVNSADFSLDASLVGQLKIDGTISTNTNDIIAIFDENENIRGVAKVSFNAALNAHLIFLSVHSNTSGDNLKFKIYDANNDKVLGSNTTITFTPNAVFGDASNPFIIEASSTLSVADFENSNGIRFYPNPVEISLNFSTNLNIKSIGIYSILGKEVLKVSNVSSLGKKINLQHLQKGIYLLKATLQDETIFTKKIIKK